MLNSKYSNPLIVAAFSNKFFSSKTSSPVKNSYLPTVPDDKAEALAARLSKLHRAFVCLIFFTIAVIVSLTVTL